MYVLDAENVNHAYEQGIRLLASQSYKTESRNGAVRVMDGPVTTLYRQPRQRCLWEKVRDVNPFFHLFESLWMLAGRNDVAYLKFLNSKMENYSDDGTVFHGAYGHRWLQHFEKDQLENIVSLLRSNPLTRRCILQMWDCESDLSPYEQGKDIPCNVVAKFELSRDSKLDMIVFNRSNDMIFGAYGANAVQFSILQEFIANRINKPVGRYWQVSSNFHAYDNVWEDKCASLDVEHEDLYHSGLAQPYPYISFPNEDYRRFYEELEKLLTLSRESNMEASSFDNPFFDDVCAPMWRTWCRWKSGDKEGAVREAKTMYTGCDWTIAAKRWMQKRLA